MMFNYAHEEMNAVRGK